MSEKKKLPHSIKVPKLYKAAAKIAKEVREEGGNLKNLVYNLKHFNTKALYALILKAIQSEDVLNKLIDWCKILEEHTFDPWLARILITELLWGKKTLNSESKPIQTVLKYQLELNNHWDTLQKTGNYHIPSVEKKKVVKPRYVRINTLVISVGDALKYFQDEGWNLIERKADDYANFLQQAIELGESEFLRDYHIKEVLLFPPQTEFWQHELYLNGSILLQDKASCLPVFLLAPKPESVVLDMCAAPGMKTTHLAAAIKNKGTVYAVEKDKQRCSTLCKMVEMSGASCVTTMLCDAVSLTSERCPNVEYILVDPSCSGSGIIGRVDEEPFPERLRKLAGFQTLLLRHALTAFPSARKVVYSTCSLLPEENEQVVEDVLAKTDTFRLVPNVLQDSWPRRGNLRYSCGEHCLYAHPEHDLTNGFFVAVFERKSDANGPAFVKGKETDRINPTEINYDTNDQTLVDKKMSKKIKKTKEALEIEHFENREEEPNEGGHCTEEFDNERKSTKKKKRKKHEKLEHDDLDLKPQDDEVIPHKKRKKQSRQELLETDNHADKTVDVTPTEKRENEEATSVLEDVQSVGSFQKKKKKKKKNRIESVCVEPVELDQVCKSEKANHRDNECNPGFESSQKKKKKNKLHDE